MLVAVLIAGVAVAACGGPVASGSGVATLDPGSSSASATSTTPSASSADPQTQMLAYARCMREHGVANFPDPVINDGGGITVTLDGSAIGMEPTSPTFQAAQQACEALLPSPEDRPAANDPAFFEQALRFAACMREHGVTNFPDPQQGGGFRVESGSGPGQPGGDNTLDPNSPVMKAAMEACQSLRPGGVTTGTRNGR